MEVKKPNLYKWLLEAEEEIKNPESIKSFLLAKKLHYVLELWEDEMLARMVEKKGKKR